MTALGACIQPCGPVIDPRPADRLLDAVEALGPLSPQARSALAPIFGASTYLAGLARRDPARLVRLLESDPDAHLEALEARVRAALS